MQECVVVTLRLPPTMAREVAELSQEAGVPKNQAYIRLLAHALQHEQPARLADVAPDTASKQRIREIVASW